MKITFDELKKCNGKCPPEIMKKSGVENFVEIGIRRGDSFVKHIKGVSKLAVAVDIWTDTDNPAQNDANYSQKTLNEQYKYFTERVEKIENPEIEVIKDFSVEASKQFDDEFFDWIFIDADHSYEGCKEDMIHWYPKLKKRWGFLWSRLYER